MNTPEYPIVAIRADDWSIDDGPIDLRNDFPLYKAWVVGFLIKENKDSITLTPELFKDRGRRCQTIPKSAIQERIEIGRIEAFARGAKAKRRN